MLCSFVPQPASPSGTSRRPPLRLALPRTQALQQQQPQQTQEASLQAAQRDDGRGRAPTGSAAGGRQEAAVQLPQLPASRASGPALAAAAATLAAVGAAAYAVLSSQPQLPPLGAVLGPAAAVALGGPPAALLAAKAVLRDKLHLELHRWGTPQLLLGLLQCF